MGAGAPASARRPEAAGRRSRDRVGVHRLRAGRRAAGSRRGRHRRVAGRCGRRSGERDRPRTRGAHQGRRRGPARRGPRSGRRPHREQPSVPADRARAQAPAGGADPRAGRRAGRWRRRSRADQADRRDRPPRPACVRGARRRDGGRRPGGRRRRAPADGGLRAGGRPRRPRWRRPVRRGKSLMPARLEIDGGVPLRGSVRVSAAKNAALPALAASLRTAEPVRLTNVPDLVDVRTMVRLVETLGATIRRERGELAAQVSRVTNDVAPYDLVSTMRASVLVLGPLVARHGSARVALPGGCAIGVRPIDQPLKGLAKLGADIAIENGYVVARASRLRGAVIATDMVTVTGTENLMMAAALAQGTTIIENAAREPEVSDLAALLNAMGARIGGAGTSRIEIEGVPALAGATHRVVPDRIEAGTLIVAGAITRGDVTVSDLVPAHLGAVLDKLDECGVAVEVGPASVRVRGPDRPRPADVTTSPFPGFPTDMQAQVMTLLGLADERHDLRLHVGREARKR